MTDAIKTWERKNQQSTLSRLVDTVKKPAPLRERISYTIYKLKTQEGRLDQSYQRMQNHYNEVFRKCTNSVLSKDSTRSSMYANECAQVKKIAQTLVTSQLALEQVVLRFETVQDFGDIAAEVMPAAAVVRSVKNRLSGVVPEVSTSLGTISQSLDSLVLEAGEATGQNWNANVLGEDAEKVLSEATLIAEQKVREGFPELPTASTEKGANPP